MLEISLGTPLLTKPYTSFPNTYDLGIMMIMVVIMMREVDNVDISATLKAQSQNVR